ncbi:MAG: hypothetical protein HYS12_08400 [Planctomycetes bacterium]|nr:hypothetical protein [Planctomycetota bacterium]
MSETKQYRFLEPRPCSNYRQLFIKGRRIRAEVLYRETVGLEPRTPEQVAEDFDVPLEAVLEAVDYCIHNEDFLRQERDREEEEIRALGLDKPPLVPPDYKPES